MTQFKTGDLFLGNTYTLDGLFEHVASPKTKWNVVGVYIVDKDVNICTMRSGGIEMISHKDMMSDPLLQSAAFRVLDVRELAAVAQKIQMTSAKSIGAPPSTPALFVDEWKGSGRQRTTLTCSEAICGILASAKLINYRDEFPIDEFQEGGSLDDSYGKEIPIIPYSTMSLSERKRIAVGHAKEMARKWIEDYIERIPVMTYENYDANPSSPPPEFQSSTQVLTPGVYSTTTLPVYRDVVEESKRQALEDMNSRSVEIHEEEQKRRQSRPNGPIKFRSRK